MTPSLSKDTQLCISLAGRPGNHGTRFHNFLYAELDLDFVYKACTTGDLPAAIGGIRALGIRGCSVSMPFKEDSIPLVDELDDSSRAISSINTIVNTDGRLLAYNTDYLAVAKLLASHQVPSTSSVAIIGSGGMAKAVAAALRDAGFRSGTVVARNASTGPALAEQYGFGWVPELSSQRPQMIVNATPVGMAGGPAADDLPTPAAVVESAEIVFDVVAMPVETPLVQQARSVGIATITGDEVSALQAAEQFELYTGIRPSDEQIRRASEHARQDVSVPR
jgi:shikimate dehydrogenase